MKHDIDTVEKFVKIGLDDVFFDDPHPRGSDGIDICGLERARVVISKSIDTDDLNRRIEREDRLCERASNETRYPGNQYFPQCRHRLSPLVPSGKWPFSLDVGHCCISLSRIRNWKRPLVAPR